MSREIPAARIAAFRAHDLPVIEAYPEPKNRRRNHGGGPGAIRYHRETAWGPCPRYGGPDGPFPHGPVPGGAPQALVWPCGDRAGAYDALCTPRRSQERKPETVLHSLSSRDRNGVRTVIGGPLRQRGRDPDPDAGFSGTPGEVAASATDRDVVVPGEGRHTFDGRPYPAGVVSENAVPSGLRHDAPPTRGGPPSAGPHAARTLGGRRPGRLLRPRNPCGEETRGRWAEHRGSPESGGPTSTVPW
ncbi:hypothetical protein SAMN02745673_04485 [Marinactinospora thermotolerans DSM 45154]|uniref:Uncharacterized protein n=1 Tax=Marinactinospora thermotolerans DSM 45154 TaxID=1122192 RepID=A0A1T4T4Y4_9ACTN|nr:hypothetical protein SAMN02745673_04485 [Marinactinospora thermotolerans DSM 45154]